MSSFKTNVSLMFSIDDSRVNISSLAASPTVNNVSIISNATLTNGIEILIISEVLFMTDTTVSKLHQQNKDKETPPLLAFPWFGSQFLSHAFLALERDNRFSQITRFAANLLNLCSQLILNHFRFLSCAEIASSIVGSNYTFFVPYDDAFEKYGFDLLPDETLSSADGIKLILNHFVKGRLYNKDLQRGGVFETVGGKVLKISADSKGQVTVNHAKVIESEIFVYNLGTMFYIDDILNPELLKTKVETITQSTKFDVKRESESSEDFYTTEVPIFSEQEDEKSMREPTTPEFKSIMSAMLATRGDVELVPGSYVHHGDRLMKMRSLSHSPPK